MSVSSESPFTRTAAGRVLLNRKRLDRKGSQILGASTDSPRSSLHAQIVMLVVVRIRRTLDLWERMFFQLLHNDLNRFLELSITTLAEGRRVKVDFDVGRNTMVLNFPIAVEAVNGGSRCGHMAPVKQFRIAANAD